jgi:hypothetical protein
MKVLLCFEIWSVGSCMIALCIGMCVLISIIIAAIKINKVEKSRRSNSEKERLDLEAELKATASETQKITLDADAPEKD